MQDVKGVEIHVDTITKFSKKFQRIRDLYIDNI